MNSDCSPQRRREHEGKTLTGAMNGPSFKKNMNSYSNMLLISSLRPLRLCGVSWDYKTFL